MQQRPVAVVTGANRGLGFEACRQLATLGQRVIMTSRRDDAGRAAAETLRGEGHEIDFVALDVTHDEDIEALAEHIRAHYGRLDVLINNAGIFADPTPGSGRDSVFDAEIATIRGALETNTLAPLRLCQKLIPLMEGSGRVVNISSGMGQLSEMNGCCPAYRLSKTALNAVTRIFADELSDTGVKINSICPGWVRTDMGGPNADRAPEQAVKHIIWAATLPEDGPSGGFFRDGKAIDW